MNVRALAAALVLAVAAPAAAQEFQMQWDFDLRRSVTNRPLQNIYPVSLPLDAWIPDLANTAATNPNKCVGDPLGPLVGDGIRNVDDLICLWWTERDAPTTAGTFSVSMIRSSECTPIVRNGQITLGRVAFTGTPFPIDPEMGLIVRVTVGAGNAASPANDGFIEGDEPEWDGVVLTAMPTCGPGEFINCCGPLAPRQHLLRVPYDTLLSYADEVLCGLEDVDWHDDDGDGRPDACWDDADGDRRRDPGEEPTGLWDGLHSLTVMRFDNSPAVNAWVSRTAMGVLDRVTLSGTNFPLVPGEALLVLMSRDHEPALWLPPVP